MMNFVVGGNHLCEYITEFCSSMIMEFIGGDCFCRWLLSSSLEMVFVAGDFPHLWRVSVSMVISVI
jgi:hypothetical protein